MFMPRRFRFILSRLEAALIVLRQQKRSRSEITVYDVKMMLKIETTNWCLTKSDENFHFCAFVVDSFCNRITIVLSIELPFIIHTRILF